MKQKGEFESCFADGLDLSELTTSTSNMVSSNQQLSHSAVLLQTKQSEIAMKLEMDQQEIQIKDHIQDQVEQLEKVVVKDETIRAYPPEQQTPTISGKDSGILVFVQPNINSSSNRSRNNNTATRTNDTSSSTSSLINGVVVGMHENFVKDDMPRKMIRNNKRMNKIAKKKSVRRKY
jgi:hypothetical protein